MKTATALARLLDSGDRKVMVRVHRWPAPRWIRLFMVCATRGGDGWLWHTLGAFILAFGGPERFAALASAASAVAVGIVLFLWLKRRIGRRRPCAIEPHCWSRLLPPDQFSFPSGHTITAFAVAASMVQFYPSLAVGLWFCAISVAVSRVLLGMHFVTDVVAGAGLGAALGLGSAATIGAWIVT